MQDVLSVILFAMSCVAFLSFSPPTRVDQNDSDTATTHDARKVAPFPWEPRVSMSQLVETTQFDNLDKTHIAREETEQLQFLASMTFAGGGLRAPSCPCCQ